MVTAERGGFGGLLQGGWAPLRLCLPTATLFLPPQRLEVLKEAMRTMLLGFFPCTLLGPCGAEEVLVTWAGGMA